MPQTSVTSAPAVAKAGMLYDAQGSADGLISVQVDEAAGVPPGRLVVRSGGGDFAGGLPAGESALTLNVLGVSVFSQKSLIAPASDANEVYEDEDTMPVARQRRMWVTFEDAHDPTDSIFVRVASGGGGSAIGAFRTDSDTASAVAWAGARILSTGSAGALALIEINI